MAKVAWALGAALGLRVLGGCGPSYDERTIKTADERMKEQEELAYEEEQRSHNKPAATGEVAEADKPGEFDDKQADLELRRATRWPETGHVRRGEWCSRCSALPS